MKKLLMGLGIAFLHVNDSIGFKGAKIIDISSDKITIEYQGKKMQYEIGQVIGEKQQQEGNITNTESPSLSSGEEMDVSYDQIMNNLSKYFSMKKGYGSILMTL